MISFTFNGERKEWLYAVKGRQKPPFASLSRNTVKIMGRKGAFLTSTDTEPLVIQQPIAFKAMTPEETQQITDDLARWLVTDEPVPLTFDDEPNREYFAIVQNTLEDFERFTQLRTGTITFLCADPHAYGEHIERTITDRSIINNQGTAEARPIFEIDVVNDLSYLEIKNSSLHDNRGVSPMISLGQAPRLEEEPIPEKELIFHDTMTDVSGWQTGSEVENSVISGEIRSDSRGFYPHLFGGATSTRIWQGPTVIKGIGEELTDFQSDVFLQSFNTQGETGMIDIYLRDANGNLIAKYGFGDAWVGKKENFGYGQIGNAGESYRDDAFADYASGWNDFDGVIRVSRVRDQWSFYYARIEEDGTHNWVHSRLMWTDTERKYSEPITSIQIGFRLWTYSERTSMRIKEIKIYRLNDFSVALPRVPLIGHSGDKIILDSNRFLVTRNGELANDLINFESHFFPLQSGENFIEVTPSEDIRVTAKYRNTYL